MTAMEDRMARTEQQEVNQRSQVGSTQVTGATTNNSRQLEEVVVPSVGALQGTPHIQAEVDGHIRHVAHLNEAGKLSPKEG